eukprot:TRINITY_DN930_c0_g1_i1.p1 TRINITY_DN930_c0_g1~~TRINITY_DN930_c0_g1_i1.p1  ORF type:complete len:1068 (-),score=228.22 TRINITY_DN930_c0_g1_i1:671-3874(-)
MLRALARGPLRQNSSRLPTTETGKALAACRSKRSFYEDATASGSNALYLESIYAQWKMDSSKLDPRWDPYFRAMEAGESPGSPPLAGSAARQAALSARLDTISPSSMPKKAYARVSGNIPTRIRAEDSSYDVDPVGLKYLIRAFQVRGHEAANLDPLGIHTWRKSKTIPELSPKFHGFSEADLDKTVSASNMLWRGSTGGNEGFLSNMSSLGGQDMTLRQIVEILEKTYCGNIGVEYMHIADRKRCNWIRQRVESPTFLQSDREKLLQIYDRLCYSDGFERFLGDKFKTTKRFGIDGGEAVIPGLKALVDRGVELGIDEFVFGMPHRGRLNILVNVLGKPMPQMLAEFLGTAWDADGIVKELQDDDWASAGDVKYHLGTSNQIEYPDVGTVTLTMEANPSHLETVGPVTLGRARAKQFYLGDEPESRSRVMPILLHGDAAFAGQGVVYESMQLAKVDDFDVGGTIHVIVNNQVGFTTDPKNSRSTNYCSDLGKAFDIPIFHCNGDDPIAVVRAFEMAAEWRQAWGRDCILDVICYRRFGHNESDNPEFTQPQIYSAIKKHHRSEEIFAQKLIEDGTATAEELDQYKSKVWQEYEQDHEAAQTYKPVPEQDWVATKWEGVRKPNELAQKKPTGVDIELLSKIGNALCKVPDSLKLHNALKRIMKAKQDRITAGAGIDWGTAEALAFGSLLLEGNHVRITGQDVQRGTFSHRHCVVHDQATGAEHSFLNAMDLGPQETFVARNSILAEYAVLGYELGYSYEGPNALVIWEAQFGDFANTAQVMFDQFISAGEHKWLQQSALTMLLPHGYDGQGAEHSSCRLERFLQMSDDDEDDVPDYDSGTQVQKANWQVMNLTTPANYFHALRQQLHRDFRKPLVIASPKALLRHKACISSFEDMGPDSKFMRLIPERDAAISANPEQVKRLVFCTGKIYYELVAEREKLGLTDVAIATVEMIAPFPFDKVRDEIAKYPNVDKGDGVHPGDIIWCQEEPKNMGAWAYVRPRMVTVSREALDMDLVVRYVGRRASAAPATGIGKLHSIEQSAVIAEALQGKLTWQESSRPTAILGHQT